MLCRRPTLLYRKPFMEKYLKNFKNCLQKEIPYCAAACPFHIDMLDFIEKMKRGGFKAAFKTYRNAVGFPMIASKLCHEPCKGVCPRKDMDSAVELGMLEKACVAYAGDRTPTDYNLPMKKKKVAVIGAGISGLACALRLCMKKYEVEIFESADRIGGSLWKHMDSAVFLADVEEQFKHEQYALHFHTPIQKVEDLGSGNYDAVYVATGQGGTDFGLLSAVRGAGDPYCTQYGAAGWFAGGGLIGDTGIYALAGGLHIGTVIDNFLKTGNLLYPKNIQQTAMCLNPANIKYAAPVKAADGKAYREEEAQREAARCIECQCDFCRTYCDLTDFYNKWPLRIRDEIMATTLPGSADVKATPAKRLLSTCNQCGLCKETCPEDIDLGGLILAGRQSMHRQKKAPWVFHDFWLRDMDFANGESAAVVKLPPGYSIGSYAFFPGCQLGASDPDLVRSTYSYLLDRQPDTGLLLRCCGAPAEWSGDTDKHQEELAIIRKNWEELGKPVLILACPTCKKKFQSYLADIPVISLYEIMAEWGGEIPAEFSAENQAHQEHQRIKTYSIFDPCASRDEDSMKEAVRRLAADTGYPLKPLPENEAFPRCCGYGGQPGIANPEYVDFVVKKRIHESDHPYITYCINCRDIFRQAGKEAIHILELLFDKGVTFEKQATISERRENRIELKKNLLKEFWKEEMREEEKRPIKVNVPAELAEKLNKERILEEDVIEVVDFCQRTGRRVYQPERGVFSGYREIGFMTYWVEYRETSEENTFDLVNAYAHRMKIELEAVWNGRKTDLDL